MQLAALSMSGNGGELWSGNGVLCCRAGNMPGNGKRRASPPQLKKAANHR
jgi:hypothetical protein